MEPPVQRAAGAADTGQRNGHLYRLKTAILNLYPLPHAL
jgi:hypothetical protein